MIRDTHTQAHTHTSTHTHTHTHTQEKSGIDIGAFSQHLSANKTEYDKLPSRTKAIAQIAVSSRQTEVGSTTTQPLQTVLAYDGDE